MKLYIKKIICIIAIAMLNIIFSNAILPLLEIHKLRSEKLSKNRLSHGKKILIKRLGGQSLFLINSITDMASRIGCDQSMQIAAKQGLGKKSLKYNTLITSACDAKNREK